jgi:hypothetical protein
VRDGVAVRTEAFAPEDREGMLACFERLQTGIDSPVTRSVHGYMDAMHRRDWQAVRECFTPDFRLVDKRGLGWGELDREATVATAVSVGDGGDFHGTVRILAVGDGAAAYVIRWEGTSTESSRWEFEYGTVSVGTDTIAYGELFEADDEAGMLARFGELTADGVRPVHPLARVMTERLVRAFNRRDWDLVRAACAPGFVGRDRRLVVALEFAGRDGMVELWQGIAGTMPGTRMSSELLAGELLPGGLVISAALTTDQAEMEEPEDTRLEYEVRTGTVRVSQEGLLLRTDVLEPDVEAVLAHYDAVKRRLLHSK